MNILFVVSDAQDWPLQMPDAEVVPERRYLTDPTYQSCQAKVINLCKSYRYQSDGYYVSMLAGIRGHDPMPSVRTLEDFQCDELLPPLVDVLDERFQPVFAAVDGEWFELRSYFGRTRHDLHAALGKHLFHHLQIPLLSAQFQRSPPGWQLRGIRAMSLAEIEPEDLDTATAAALEFSKELRAQKRRTATQRPRVAILRSPDCPLLPSNPAAIQKFQEAAEVLGMRPELLTRADKEKVAQFDGLFIRDTTNVHHYTYQLARQAAAAGMVVMDDPDSILKCSSKIYMAELLGRNQIPIPKTMMVHRDDLDRIIPALGLPLILKQPDGCFSIGVVKIESIEEIAVKAEALFATSEIVIAQEYVPTQFDWRIGVLDREPLFACRYFMAPGHWQVIKHDKHLSHEGFTEAVPISDTPPEVLDVAMHAANLIGDGFYGVDIKQSGNQCYVIEINDNPNVDAGNEDAVLKDDLYYRVMSVFKKRIDARKGYVS